MKTMASYGVLAALFGGMVRQAPANGKGSLEEMKETYQKAADKAAPPPPESRQVRRARERAAAKRRRQNERMR